MMIKCNACNRVRQQHVHPCPACRCPEFMLLKVFRVLALEMGDRNDLAEKQTWVVKGDNLGMLAVRTLIRELEGQGYERGVSIDVERDLLNTGQQRTAPRPLPGRCTPLEPVVEPEPPAAPPTPQRASVIRQTAFDFDVRSEPYT